MDQSVVDRAVNLATRAALNGHPVERVIWEPPRLGSSDPRGTFIVVTFRPLGAGDTPPWER